MPWLTENEKEIYRQCRGFCGICIVQGGCDLEDRIDDLSEKERILLLE